MRDRPPKVPPLEMEAFGTHLFRGVCPLKAPTKKSKIEEEFANICNLGRKSSNKLDHFGPEMGRRGSPRAHTLGK